MSQPVGRVGVIFSGGPAPGANAVIAATAVSFLANGWEVVGFFHGYSHLQAYHPVSHRLLPNEHYRLLTDEVVTGLRNERGIVIGTARANPGKGIRGTEDLADPARNDKLRNVYSALVDLQIDALVSIGGDDTLKTANFLYGYQQTLPADAPRVKIIHLPKTIDNDYEGIDFTFGFFTAVDFMAKEVMNLMADARATGSYFLVESMGRKAGWLAYGVGIAGEASHVIGVEDVGPDLRDGEGSLSVDKLAARIVDVIQRREEKGLQHGVIIVAEGLAEMLPERYTAGVGRDEHGHLSLGKVDASALIMDAVSALYTARTGRTKGVKGVQLGYESRCAPPHAFDVMLGSQLGIGAYRAIVEEDLDGRMVSVSGQLDLHYVPFADLVDPVTLKTKVRFIETDSDFHRLMRFLQTSPAAGGQG